MCGFCNVWVRLCVGFVMCGCVCVWVLCLGVCVCVGFVMCGCVCVGFIFGCVCVGFMFGCVYVWVL